MAPGLSGAVAVLTPDVPREALDNTLTGLNHGVGHSLLLLYDIKAPNGQKNKEFKGLRHYPSNTALSLF